MAQKMFPTRLVPLLPPSKFLIKNPAFHAVPDLIRNIPDESTPFWFTKGLLTSPWSSIEKRFFSLEMENKAQQPAQGKQLIKNFISSGYSFSKESFLLKFLGASSSTPTPQTTSSSGQNSPGKYSELLAVIEELGKDIRPTYAGSKNAAERLKKGKLKISFVSTRTFLQAHLCFRFTTPLLSAWLITHVFHILSWNFGWRIPGRVKINWTIPDS